MNGKLMRSKRTIKAVQEGRYHGDQADPSMHKQLDELVYFIYPTVLLKLKRQFKVCTK
jgi:hypothetical protein